MWGADRILCSGILFGSGRAVGRVLAAAAPALVLLACGADGPERATAASGCEGDGCSGGGAVLEESLAVELSPEGAGTGQVRYVLRNDGPLPQRVLLRETPIGGGAAAFEVRRDGEPVPYIGPFVTWAPPSDAALASLESGQSVSKLVDLTKVYDMTRPCQYSVKLLQLSGTTSQETPQDQHWAAPAMSEGAPQVAVSVDVEHATVPARGSVEKAVIIQIDPDFIGNCSVPQQGILGDAQDLSFRFLSDIEAARSTLTAASVSSIPVTAGRLLSILNASSQSDRTFVVDTYDRIHTALVPTEYVCEPPEGGLDFCTKDGVTGDCCNVLFDGATAVTNQPRNVVLCPLFFQQAPNNRARILIHEASHQAGTGGAKDPPAEFNGVPTSFPGIHTAASYELFSDKCTSPSSCFQ